MKSLTLSSYRLSGRVVESWCSLFFDEITRHDLFSLFFCLSVFPSNDNDDTHDWFWRTVFQTGNDRYPVPLFYFPFFFPLFRWSQYMQEYSRMG